jgi:hypothetical protein
LKQGEIQSIFILVDFQKMTMKDRLEEVQSLPEVPAIAHFCSLFHTVLGLEEFDIAQLETALVSCQRPPTGKNSCQSGGDGEFSFSNDDNSCAFLENLLVQLVRGCVPLHAKRINEDNYLTYTKQLFQAGLCIWKLFVNLTLAISVDNFVYRSGSFLKTVAS